MGIHGYITRTRNTAIRFTASCCALLLYDIEYDLPSCSPPMILSARNFDVFWAFGRFAPPKGVLGSGRIGVQAILEILALLHFVCVGNLLRARSARSSRHQELVEAAHTMSSASTLCVPCPLCLASAHYPLGLTGEAPREPRRRQVGTQDPLASHPGPVELRTSSRLGS